MSGKPNSKWMQTMIQTRGSREAVREEMARIGAKGGRSGHTGGFAIDVYCNCGDIEKLHHKSQCAGKRGGTVSRRRPKNAVKER